MQSWEYPCKLDNPDRDPPGVYQRSDWQHFGCQWMKNPRPPASRIRRLNPVSVESKVISVMRISREYSGE